MQLNGGTPTTTTYNAANQITSAGFTYDNAGNLTNDGTAAYTYDALNCMRVRGTTTYTYTGDGTLISQATGGITTRYTQDLAAPLSQVLQTKVGAAPITDYIYGLNRIASLSGSTKTWYASDALGSVRRTVADAGTPLGIVNYDPWGTPESGTVPTFGFTGEVQDVSSGLVNLRARWYSTGRGRFTSVDPFAGVPETPYSQHAYQYGYSDPVLLSDPSGRCSHSGDDYCFPDTRPAGGSEQSQDATGGVRMSPVDVPIQAPVGPIQGPVPPIVNGGMPYEIPAAVAAEEGAAAASEAVAGEMAAGALGEAAAAEGASSFLGPVGLLGCALILSFILPQPYVPPPSGPQPVPAPPPLPATQPQSQATGTPQPLAQPQPQPAPTPVRTATATPNKENRGKLQIQGRDIIGHPDAKKDTLSWSWSRVGSVTASEGLQQLELLWNKLNKQQQRRRMTAYQQARRYIASGPPLGHRYKGRSFSYAREQNGIWDARVDVAIDDGVAFDK